MSDYTELVKQYRQMVQDGGDGSDYRAMADAMADAIERLEARLEIYPDLHLAEVEKAEAERDAAVALLREWLDYPRPKWFDRVKWFLAALNGGEK